MKLVAQACTYKEVALLLLGAADLLGCDEALEVLELSRARLARPGASVQQHCSATDKALSGHLAA